MMVMFYPASMFLFNVLSRKREQNTRQHSHISIGAPQFGKWHGKLGDSGDVELWANFTVFLLS